MVYYLNEVLWFINEAGNKVAPARKQILSPKRRIYLLFNNMLPGFYANNYTKALQPTESNQPQIIVRLLQNAVLPVIQGQIGAGSYKKNINNEEKGHFIFH